MEERELNVKEKKNEEIGETDQGHATDTTTKQSVSSDAKLNEIKSTHTSDKQLATSTEQTPPAPARRPGPGRPRVHRENNEARAPKPSKSNDLRPQQPVQQQQSSTAISQQIQPQQSAQQHAVSAQPQQNTSVVTQQPQQRQQDYQQQHHRPREYNKNYHQDYRNPVEHAPIRLEDYSLQDLNAYARRFGIIGAGLMAKDLLISKIRYAEAHPDMEMGVDGVIEKLPDGFGFLRSAKYDYVSGPDDVYVSPSQIRRFNLRTGDTISGVIRKPKEGEKYFALLKITSINFKDPVETGDRPHFDRLTPAHPTKKYDLEFDPNAVSTRIMDLFTPIGKGQRGLIVAPPKVGKTVLLKELAQSIIANSPETYLIVLLIDERPEEVADMKKTVKGASAEVISSTFDEAVERHVQVVEIVLEKAKRLVESGNDVFIILDSITRLARAYNTTAPASGKVLTGGVDAHALHWPKRFFGAARATEEAGSLTIIASALVDTGSRMDEVIYEEFKGTGNMEMHMTRKLSNRRTYPAFDLLMSGTRREELLHSEDDLNKVWVLQKFLSTMNTVEGVEFLIDKMKKFKTNREFLESINKK